MGQTKGHGPLAMALNGVEERRNELEELIGEQPELCDTPPVESASLALRH